MYTVYIERGTDREKERGTQRKRERRLEEFRVNAAACGGKREGTRKGEKS